MKKFMLISGAIFFLYMLIFSYFFIYHEIDEAFKFTVISTLIFVPINFLLNKFFNKKFF
jgi:hypothetical protein